MKPAEALQEPSMIAETGYWVLPGPGKLPGQRRNPARLIIDNKKGYFIAKRAFDLLISIFFIIAVLSWLVPVMGIIIRLTSHGPVFFLQKRVGRGGRSFTCIKFRTMVINGKADTQEARENDERITKLGRFLRKSNLDEFPQFFNVLAGSMSVVGPRPHMHADCSRYASIVPGYKFRNFVKPGITGLSQVKGYHGRVISNECISSRFFWDAYYVRHSNFSMDIRIIFITAIQRIRFLIRL